MPVHDPLLRRGFLPKELPPAFCSTTFADAIAKSAPPIEFVAGGLLNNPPIAQTACHHLTRPGGTRRQLGVPSPVLYNQLSHLINLNWPAIQQHFASTTSAFSTPVLDGRNKRGITGRHLHDNNYHRYAANRAGRRYLLVTDIESCYRNVYSHSLPWAIHGKSASKQNRRQTWSTKGGLYGNDIDFALRNSQDGQTVGIPIGPDTSLIVWEIIGTSIDQLVSQSFPRYLRVIDDIEIATNTFNEAEEAQSFLEEVLGQFELQINPRKTRIIELPSPIEESWLHLVRDYVISQQSTKQAKDIEKYFQALFVAKSQYPKSHVLSYGLQRFVTEAIAPQNAQLLHDLLWQCVAAEPSSLRFALGAFEQHKIQGVKIDLTLLESVLSDLIYTGVSVDRGNQVAWAIWGLLLFQRKISRKAVKLLPRSRDPFVGIMAIDAERCGLCKYGLDTSAYLPHLVADELRGRMWPLAYEIRARNWLSTPTNYVTADAAFNYLDANKVRFYTSFSKATQKKIKKQPKISLNLKQLLSSQQSNASAAATSAGD